jgi:hypothetical protein
MVSRRMTAIRLTELGAFVSGLDASSTPEEARRRAIGGFKYRSSTCHDCWSLRASSARRIITHRTDETNCRWRAADGGLQTAGCRRRATDGGPQMAGGLIDIRPITIDDAAQVRDLFIRVNRLLAPPHLKEAFETYIANSLREGN